MKTMRMRSEWIFMIIWCVAVWAGRSEGVVTQLRITTVPPGATVVCDGMLRDASPVTIDDLAPGSHLVHAELTGYIPCRKTVSVTEGEKAAVEITLEKEAGLVLVHSDPDGADIVLDGAQRGKTPLLLTDVPRGNYRIKASTPGYQDCEMELKVEGRTPQKLMMTLHSDSARLTINSIPSGAVVVVNGLSRGATPCVVDRVPAGESKIVVSMADYALYQGTVTLRAGDDHKVDVELNPLPASLSVVGAPMGAKVYVNDQLRGQVPLSIGTIPPGSYSVRVEMPGYAPETRTIELKNRDARTAEFDLVRNVGVLEAVTDQPGASILVNGENKGTPPVQGDHVVEPLRIELPVGDHQVEFRKKGYFSVVKRVTIIKGTSVSLREAMKRNFVADTAVRLRSNEVVSGVAGRKLPGGDVEIETGPGIFRTLKAEEILAVEPLEVPVK